MTRAAEEISKHSRQNISFRNSRPVSGGCINRCYQLETSSGNYFLKYNDATLYPEMFASEAKGLKLLAAADAIDVPAVISCGEEGSFSFLILEWIESGRREKNFWADFGMRLAQMHRCTAEKSGLDHDNYIGSLPQSNRESNNWIDFFIHERLEPQLKLARDSGLIASPDEKSFEKLISKLPQLIPVEKPALLHGDLWNGNFLVNPKGKASLIDPAVYYGHREMDLAMTKLFGGFDSEFYSAYNEVFPLEKGFESRTDIHNLYPLLVHVNLFGGGYVEQVKEILNRF